MHTVTLSEKGLVDLHVAGLEVEIGVDAQCLLVLGVVHPSVDPVHLLVAKVTILRPVTLRELVWSVKAHDYVNLPLPAHIIHVEPELCVRTIRTRTPIAGKGISR